MSDTRSVAIVGLGPKGLHCLERLLAELAVEHFGASVEIHLVHRTCEFGVSGIYDPRQPDYILTNNSVADIDVWSSDDPPPVGGRGPNFVEWYNCLPATTEPIDGSEYLPRATVGRYLHAAFLHLVAHVPHDVRLVQHVGEAIDIRAQGSRRAVVVALADGPRVEIVADHVLLATGHSRAAPSDDDRALLSFAAGSRAARYIPFVFPLRETLGDIRMNDRVAIRGMGLTFIDTVLELTEGRGGRFVRADGGALEYLRSGHEPLAIFPFARFGLPAIPKAVDLPKTRRTLTFTQPERLAAIRAAAGGRQLDFDAEIWPLVELEMEHAYFQAATGRAPCPTQIEIDPADPKAIRATLREFRRGNPTCPPFDLREIVDPPGIAEPLSPRKRHGFVTDYLARETARAQQGHQRSPLKGAVDLWFEIRYALEVVLQFGGLTPESHRRLKHVHFARLKRAVFGPPVINAEKILALARARVIDFGFSRSPTVECDANVDTLRLRACDGASTPISVLVNAQVPEVPIHRDASPLFKSLLARGMIRPHSNGGFEPGAIDMTPETQLVVGRAGNVDDVIAVIGIPTEGNLVGNLNVTPGPFSRHWAQRVALNLSRLPATSV